MDPSRKDSSVADDALVMRARNGDHEAFGELVTRHQRRVWMVCRQYVGVDEADAAAQDSLVKAFTGIRSFDGRALFSTWLTRIAINTCLDQLRRRRREGQTVEDSKNDEERGGGLELVVDDQAGPEDRTLQHQALESLAKSEN